MYLSNMFCKKFGELVQGISTRSLKRDGAASGRRSFSWTSVCQHRALFLNRRACPAVQLRPVPNHVRACYASQSTVDPDEVKKFQALASKWWDEQGEFAALHSMNDLRVPFIRDNLMRVHGGRHPGKPLAGLRILDMGCGGGLLTEPLGRLGADVLGIDPAANSIGTAELHTFRDPELLGRVSYRACTLEELSQGLEGEGEGEGEGGEAVEGEEESFDAVVASEVVEHLADLDTFALCCGDVLKPGGSLFITTISKTNLSYALAIVAAERVLGIVPSGTHDWDKFITPVDLERLLESNGFSVESIQGMLYNPVSGGWSWTQSTSVNYALHAVKRTEEAPPGHTQTGPAHTGGRDAAPPGHS